MKLTGKSILTIAILSALSMACVQQSTSKTANTEERKEETTINNKSNMKPIYLTKAEFLTKVANYETTPDKWVYLGDKPCLIDFYADWCGPCKAIAPVLEELAKEYDGRIYIYKIDTEKEMELASAFGIRSIPTLLFCPMNESPQMAQGALPKDTLKKAIDDILLKK